ncbi:MAG: hypothetical protein HZB42_14880 [Sphingobacteriales bacterium]|nr:hypothetical protein [Sphingobacteriales bacterium]
MLSAKSITPKKTKTLHCKRLTILVLLFTAFNPAFSQDNSPYSRYGIGNLVPHSNIITRGMGGISAAYSDFLSINFSNPATFSGFQTGVETKSKKITSGRAILDLGLDFESRSLREPSNPKKFTASNALFSYVQVGVPLRKEWGLVFGLRPVSRISYKMFHYERLKDPLTGNPIDSVITRYEGDGGSFLASLGTGFSIFRKEYTEGPMKGMEKKLSFGINAGYFFGKKDYSTRRSFINDSVNYYQANYQTKTTFGDIYFNAGLNYKTPLNKYVNLTLGAYGNWGQKINSRQDILRETFVYDENLGEVRLDSVSDQRDVKGKITIPSSYTIGFIVQKLVVIEKDRKEPGWVVGLDFSVQNWDSYRLYGKRDSVRNTWEVRIGGQFNPVPKKNYFSNITYRAGLFMGPDYIKVGKNLPRFGGSFGMGLPISINRQAPNQYTLLNVAFEYGKRGNNDNLLKENLFRFSLGFSLSDIWFGKRKYD